MSQDQRHQGFGEQEDEAISIGEVLQILVRNLRLISLVTLVVSALTVFWVATRTPVFSAKATLLLEADESTSGVLSQLSSLTSDPAAEAEIALIRSRSLARMTAQTPLDFDYSGGLYDDTEPDFDPVGSAEALLDAGQAWDMPRMESLGLGTVVEPYDLQPHAGIRRRLTGAKAADHRLRARMALLPGRSDEEPRPESLDVFFASDISVRIAPYRRFLFAPSIRSDDEDVLELDFRTGEELQAHGYSLRLAPFGDFVGQRYRIMLVSELHATAALMASTSAAEAGRQTNVVNVTVLDSSPYRAAEIANALAKNYIRRSVQIGRQKATRTLGFIQRQLNKQIASLGKAEQQVADLQSKNPETISLSDSAKAIIDVISALELNRTQLQLAESVLRQAVSHLDDGDHVALARLGQETPNLLALGYIQELAKLETEALRLERTDVAGYKQLLLAEQLRIAVRIQDAELLVQTYEAGLAAIEAGDSSALVRLAALSSGADSRSELEPYIASLAQFDTEIARMGAGAMPANPALQALIKGRAELAGKLLGQVSGSLAGARAALQGYQSLFDDYSASIDQWPASERLTIDLSVESLRESVRANLNSQLEGLGEQVLEITGKIQEQNQTLGSLPQSQLALAQATRDQATLGGIVAFLLKSEQEAQITAAATSAAAVLIDPAVPPSGRQFPHTLTFVLLGLVIGLILGGALALVRNAMQAALHTEAEVERASGLPIIGAIPDYTRGRTKQKAARGGKRFLPMRDAPHGPQAEAYRAVRAALKQAMHGDNALRTLAATSCVMGEGKTVTNCDLAIVFTKAGRRVLLVDCDLRRPQVHKLFDVPRGPGFGEVLESDQDWRECVVPSGIEGLSILTAGQTKANAGELLVSRRARQIIEELKDAYDLVVFDVPPAVVVADVASFASNLDALLLVYRSGVVPGRLLTRTVNMLRQTDVKVLGIIVNAIYMGRLTSGYSYGYGEEYASLPEDPEDSHKGHGDQS